MANWQEQGTVVGGQSTGVSPRRHRAVADRERVGVGIGDRPGVGVVVESGLGAGGEGKACPRVLVKRRQRMVQGGRTQGAGEEGRGEGVQGVVGRSQKSTLGVGGTREGLVVVRVLMLRVSGIPERRREVPL